MTIPTLQDIEDSKKAMDDIQSFTYLGADNFVDAKGVTRDTVNGRLKKMGYDVPIVYTGGIVFSSSDNVKTVEEADVVYAPLPSSLPFTTSGTFIGDDDARFFVVQGVTNERIINDISILYSFDTIALMTSSLISFPTGKVIITKGSVSKSDGLGAMYISFSPQTINSGDETLDNGNVAVFQYSGSTNKTDIIPLQDRTSGNLVLRSQTEIAALNSSNIDSVATTFEGKQFDISVSVNGLENTPDTIKMADGRFAERVGGFKPQRLGAFKTSDAFGHRVGDFHYIKHSQTSATLLTDLSRYIPFTSEDATIPSVTVGYVDHNRPDNLGDGLTWATAKQGLNQGRELDTDILFIRAGIYNRLNRFFDWSLAKNRSMIAVGGKVIAGLLASGVWTKTGGQTNVYQLDYVAGLTNVTNAVYDTKQLNSEGAASRYTSVASIAAVEALAGSFFHTGTTTYVNTLDSRDLVIHGDEMRLTQPVENFTLTVEGNFKLYWENIEIWGGSTSGVRILSDNNEWPGSSFYNRDCGFLACQSGGNGNGLSVFDIGVCISERATITNNRRDGFNYHIGTLVGSTTLAPHGVEIDCQSHGNGELGSENNNQGSTAHENCKVFRINSDYSGHADGGCIVDIEGVKAYNVCCTAKNSSIVGMSLSASGWPFEVNDAIWWIDGGHCSGNPAIGNGLGDIAIDGFFTQLHMQDIDTEKPLSTRTFSNLPDEDFS